MNAMEMKAALNAAREVATIDTSALNAVRAMATIDTSALNAARAAVATIDTSALNAVRAAVATIDMSALNAVRAAVATIDMSALNAARAAVATIDTSALNAVRAAVATIDTSALNAAMKAMPRLDPGLFGEAWNERLAAAVGRLERAEDIVTAAPKPKRAVEALATDTDTVREAAPPEVREGMDWWLQLFWVYLAQKFFLDPLLDPAIQGAREAAIQIVMVLMVLATPVPALPPVSTLLESGGIESETKALTLPGGWDVVGLPPIVLRAGPRAAERMVEFFTTQIRNATTHAAYSAAVKQFFAWCDKQGLELDQISPIAVATYIEAMQGAYRAPTIKQHLAAIRRLFDFLVVGQVVPTNPAAAVRGPLVQQARIASVLPVLCQNSTLLK